jgi:phosphatidylglycerophosphate synthase
MPLNLPILLTWLRILLIPVFLVVFYFPGHLAHGTG